MKNFQLETGSYTAGSPSCLTRKKVHPPVEGRVGSGKNPSKVSLLPSAWSLSPDPFINGTNTWGDQGMAKVYPSRAARP